jgi:hypothetical protein
MKEDLGNVKGTAVLHFFNAEDLADIYVTIPVYFNKAVRSYHFK